jgi:uncharacterized membrane protein YgdD (TMEM256/DUF423 family)
MEPMHNQAAGLRAELGSRRVIVAAGLTGAMGVVAAAGASHAGESRNLSAIAMICLAHGPALLALGLLGRGRVLGLASALLAFGTILFAADLAVREWLGHGVFVGAAPLGGAGMFCGWFMVIAAGVMPRPFSK